MVSPTPGENPVTAGELGMAVHEKIAPATSEVKGMVMVPFAQIEPESGELVRWGMGFTVIVKSVTGPLHPLA